METLITYSKSRIACKSSLLKLILNSWKCKINKLDRIHFRDRFFKLFYFKYFQYEIPLFAKAEEVIMTIEIVKCETNNIKC